LAALDSRGGSIYDSYEPVVAPEPLPPSPVAEQAAPAKRMGPPGWQNGLSDVPESVRRTNSGREPWRQFTHLFE